MKDHYFSSVEMGYDRFGEQGGSGPARSSLFQNVCFPQEELPTQRYVFQRKNSPSSASYTTLLLSIYLENSTGLAKSYVHTYCLSVYSFGALQLFDGIVMFQLFY